VVPGAGKTLVGLEVAIKQTYQGCKDLLKMKVLSFYLCNGPLVAVIN
jgi:hypothetical protein